MKSLETVVITGEVIQRKKKLPLICKSFQNTRSVNIKKVEAKDDDKGISKEIRYNFTDECQLADCQVRAIFAIFYETVAFDGMFDSCSVKTAKALK